MHQFVMWRKLQLTKRATQQLKKSKRRLVQLCQAYQQQFFHLSISSVYIRHNNFKKGLKKLNSQLLKVNLDLF